MLQNPDASIGPDPAEKEAITKKLIEEAKQKKHDDFISKMVAEGKAQQPVPGATGQTDAMANQAQFAGQLGSLTANLAKNLGTIDKELKPYIGQSQGQDAQPVPTAVV